MSLEYFFYIKNSNIFENLNPNINKMNTDYIICRLQHVEVEPSRWSHTHDDTADVDDYHDGNKG